MNNALTAQYVQGDAAAVFTSDNQIIVWNERELPSADGSRHYYFVSENDVEIHNNPDGSQSTSGTTGEWICARLTWDEVVARAGSIELEGYKDAIESALFRAAQNWARITANAEPRYVD